MQRQASRPSHGCPAPFLPPACLGHHLGVWGSANSSFYPTPMPLSSPVSPPQPCPLLTPYFPKVDWPYPLKVTLTPSLSSPSSYPREAREGGGGVCREKSKKPPDLVCLPGARDRRSRKGRALQEVGPAICRVEGLPQSQLLVWVWLPRLAGWLPGNKACLQAGQEEGWAVVAARIPRDQLAPCPPVLAPIPKSQERKLRKKSSRGALDKASSLISIPWSLLILGKLSHCGQVGPSLGFRNRRR